MLQLLENRSHSTLQVQKPGNSGRRTETEVEPIKRADITPPSQHSSLLLIIALICPDIRRKSPVLWFILLFKRSSNKRKSSGLSKSRNALLQVPSRKVLYTPGSHQRPALFHELSITRTFTSVPIPVRGPRNMRLFPPNSMPIFYEENGVTGLMEQDLT
ncbi:hypothetical protein O181_006048 [Austropuccinia psidii MF-1]|uniref:Uncharacterized protein n=1 Tax=Austropuccinia psidii MF-1 TaxID=1389203 RepID=A0A9Q3BJQ3_9BASI|nr:hypothetical protein [Austropuccinia psidii MF-1]